MCQSLDWAWGPSGGQSQLFQLLQSGGGTTAKKQMSRKEMCDYRLGHLNVLSGMKEMDRVL